MIFSEAARLFNFFFLREENNNEKDTYTTLSIKKIILGNHLGGGPVVRA